MDNMEYNNNKDIENSLNNTIKRIVGDLANLSFTYLLKETHLTYEEYNNVKKCKEIIIQTMIPVVISGLKSENKYNLDYVVNHIFLDKFSIFDNTEILKIKIRLENIHIDSLYSLFYHTSETILYFFELIDSDNNVITDTNKENLHTEKLLTFTNLFSILLDLYFSNHQQLSNLNINNLKELINNINNNLNNKIINNKDIINLVSLLSNVNYKCRIEILKYFNVDLTEKITQLTNLNFKDLKSKNNNEKIDKSALVKIKETLNTFINTSAITLVIIKAIVYIVNLITEKIPMLSSVIGKGSNMITDTINSIGSSISLFSDRTGKTKISKANPTSEHSTTDNGETKDYASKGKGRKNNKDTNNQLGNNGNISNNPDLETDKGNIPNGDGSITITPPSGTNGGIGNSSNPLIPVQNDGDNKTNRKKDTKTISSESKENETDNPQITKNNNDGTKDTVADGAENDEMYNSKISKFNNRKKRFSDFTNENKYSVNINNERNTENNNYLQNNIKQQEENKIPNPLENNPTPTQSTINTDNTTDINNTDNTKNTKTDNNKNLANNLSNNSSQNKPTSFQDKIKKKTNNTKSTIRKVIEEHEENENKSHTEIIKKKENEKGDDSPDNSPGLR